MMDALQPLAVLPGVEIVMLATDDGVPIAITGNEQGDDDSNDGRVVGRDDALAALAVGWSNELKLATAPLSWDEPVRIVMRCSRGSIVMRKARGAILLLILAKGVSPEDVRLSMDGAVARIERSLRNMGGRTCASSLARVDAPPAAIPSSGVAEQHDEIHTSSNISGRDQASGT